MGGHTPLAKPFASERMWVAALAVFTITVVAFWGMLVWRDRGFVLDTAEAHARALAQLMQVDASRAIDAADEVLRDAVAAVGDWDFQEPSQAARLHEKLRHSLVGTPQVSSAWIMNSRGMTVVDTWNHPPLPSSGAQRQYFQAHLAGEPGPLLNATAVGPVSGRQRFTLSRPIRGPAGSLRGVVVAGVYADYFRDIYKAAGPVTKGAVSLLLLDGAVLARWPTDVEVLSPEGLRTLLDRVKSEPSGMTILAGTDEQRLVSWARLSDFPAFALVSQPVPAALLEWRVRTAISAALAAAVLLGFAGIAVLGRRSARAEQGARQSLARLNAELDARVEARTSELAATYATAPIGLCVLDTELRFVRINERMAEINGIPAADHIGRSMREIVPTMAEQAEAVLQRTLDTGEAVLNVEFEGETPAQPGAKRMWSESWFPLRDHAGRIIGINVVAEEITERKQDEARLKLLAREVDHRSKNMLAVLQAMVRMTRADNVADYAKAVQGRVAALARAHTLLASSRWEGADLKRLVEEELAPYRRGDGMRVRAEGQPLAIKPAAAQSMAMALHELATNAVKYGALSAAGGRVTVRWRTGIDGRLTVEWTERGGPAVMPPTRSGLGTGVIARTIRDQLDGDVRFDWDPTGLSCLIVVPTDKIVVTQVAA